MNAAVSPVLGAFSDWGGRRMPFLLGFTALCIGATFFIADVPPVLGVALFIVANFAYQAALIYYDATLKTVSTPASRGRLSGIGTGIGYCGTVFIGLLIFLLDVPVQDRFRLTSILFLVFAIPIFWFVRERRRPDERRVTRADVADSFGQLKRSIAHSRTVPGLWRFLLGRFFYSDAVNTVIVVMSVVVVKTMGLSDATANVILLLLTLVAIVMSFVWGWLVDRNGPKRTLVWVLVSWAVGLVLGGVAIGFGQAGLVPFLVAGAILGSGLGGVQVADRVLMVRLSPPERIGEFFGIYGLVGKGSQVVGQILYGSADLPAAGHARQRRLPGGRAEPARDDAHRVVAGVAGQRPLGGLGRARGPRRSMRRRRRRGWRPTARRSRTGARVDRSVAVAVRMRAPPRPRRSDHLVQRRAARQPAEDLAGAGVRRHEHRRVARSWLADRVGDRPADGGARRPPGPRARRTRSTCPGCTRGRRPAPPSPFASAVRAATCASARSATWM